jgi:Phage integrase, N-terminal SAM-like domain
MIPARTSLASAESRLRLHVRPWFADRPIDKITPADVRRWQAHLDHEDVFGQVKRRALTPEEAGRLLACSRGSGGTT